MAAKTKSLKSGERYAVIHLESKRVVDTRFIAPVYDKDGEIANAKTSVPDGCAIYPAPTGVVGLAKGKLVADVPALQAIVDDADKAAADRAGKASVKAADGEADTSAADASGISSPK